MRLQVYSFEGVIPVVDPSAFVHPSAVLIGKVLIGPGVFIGPCASLRGDFGRLIVRAGANVQDGCVMHGYPETDTVVEENGHIGHGSVLHGCIVRRDAMVGMNAVIMDRAEVGEASIIAASAFVKSDWIVPARVLVAGVPARVVRALSEEEIAAKRKGTQTYQALARRSLASMQRVSPLSSPEEGWGAEGEGSPR